jgi:hypothetical protein
MMNGPDGKEIQIGTIEYKRKVFICRDEQIDDKL